MTATRKKIEVGTKFRLDGEEVQVTRLSGGTVTLRAKDGGVSVNLLSNVLTDPSFHFLDAPASYERKPPAFLDNVPRHLLEKARILEGHLLEAMTGYVSGTKADAKQSEPRKQYDDSTYSLTQRLASKAKELEHSFRWLTTLKTRYLSAGLYGLVDSRALRTSKSGVDMRIVEALNSVVAELKGMSNVTNNTVRRKTEARLKSLYPEEDIRMLTESSFNRFYSELKRKHGMSASPKSRSSAANRPETPYSHFRANRPGEMIVIDSTPLDAFAMDPYSWSWVPVQLTIALDLYTRSIVGWRFTPVSTQAVDASLLLWDVLRPKKQRLGWPEALRFAYVGVPESIVMEVGDDAPGSGLTAIPFVNPESVIVDRGRVFIGQVFSDACNKLGINLYIARPYTPTDKAHVERVFRSIRENFVEALPGYKGPNVYSRGEDIEKGAYFFIDEIEEKFALWVATWWQRRHHDGLQLPLIPNFKLSPNDAFEEGIAKAGFLYAVPYDELYYELLPTEWRTIQHYGLDLRGLVYDDEILDSFRNTKSSYLGEHAGKYPIKFDPRDRSAVFFHDAELNRWYAVSWIGNYATPRPFDEKTLSYAKAMIIKNGGNPNNNEEIRRELNALLNSMDDQSLEGPRERRLAAVRLIQAQASATDRPKDLHSLGAPDAPSDLLPRPTHTVAPLISQEPAQTIDADDLIAYPSAAEVAEDFDDEF